MTKVYVNGGMPYAKDFLEGMAGDLWQLAAALQKSGAFKSTDVTTLMQASNIVLHVKDHNINEAYKLGEKP